MALPDIKKWLADHLGHEEPDSRAARVTASLLKQVDTELILDKDAKNWGSLQELVRRYKSESTTPELLLELWGAFGIMRVKEKIILLR